MFSSKVNSFKLSNNRPNLPLLIIPPQKKMQRNLSSSSSSSDQGSPNIFGSPNITPQFGVPSLILPGLYLSGIDCVNEAILDKYNIKHVISVMNNPPILSDKYKRLCIQINDDFTAVIRPYFEKAHEFINQALDNGENVLIHCYAGISRSATIVISYVMKYKGISNHQALKFVRHKRNIIEPNFLFCCNLENYEKEINK